MRTDWRNWNFIAYSAHNKRAELTAVCESNKLRRTTQCAWTLEQLNFSVLGSCSFAWLLPLRFGFCVRDTFGRIRIVTRTYFICIKVFLAIWPREKFLYLIWNSFFFSSYCRSSAAVALALCYGCYSSFVYGYTSQINCIDWDVR